MRSVPAADSLPRPKCLHGWGLAAVIALALLGTFENLLPIFDQPGARGHFDWASDPGDQTLITRIDRSGTAERAGVRVGDRIDLDRLYPERTTINDPIINFVRLPGIRVAYPLIRDSKHITVAISMGSGMTQPLYETLVDDLSYLIEALVVILGAWMVVRRPTLMTWGLFVYLLPASNPPVLSRFGYDVVLANNLILAAMAGCVPLLIAFASRVPNDATSTWRRWFEIAAIALCLVFLCTNIYPIVAWSMLGLSSRYVFIPTLLNYGLYYTFVTLVLLAITLNYILSRGQDRERMRWVALGVIMNTVGNVATSFDHGPLFDTLVYAFAVSGLVAIAYGIIKGRIVDVTFALSHAVVASVLAGSVIAVFAIVDWLGHTVLASTRLGTFAEIGLAVALGFWFNGLHRRVDATVDRLFFRKRYIAGERLSRAAHAVLHSTSMDAVRGFLVDEPHAALDLSSAALFESMEGLRWKRSRAIGWPEGTLVDLADSDPVVLHVLAEQAPVKTTHMRWTTPSLPIGLAQPVIAVPVLARRHVVAIALYGQHASGADIDADEIASLERLAEAAGAALDHVEAENLRRENEAQARRIEDLMRQLSPRAT